MKKLAATQKLEIAAIAAKTDATIDFSEMPEVVDWSGAEIGRFHRPTKRPVTIRLDDDVINWLKSFGRGYQTKANLLLRHAMEATRGRSVEYQRVSSVDSKDKFRSSQGNAEHKTLAEILIQIEIAPLSDDDPEFVHTVAKAINGMLRRCSPKNIALIKIDNWFGSRWLGFCGTICFGKYARAGVSVRPSYLDHKHLTIPPFVPERVVSQRRFAGPEFRETDAGKLIHMQIPSKLALRRKVAVEEPETALAWYSGNTIANGRGSLMVYLPDGSSYCAWFVDLEHRESWQITEARGISPDEFSLLLEEGSVLHASTLPN
jgi:uncharacterized protein (DUF4415 family)